MPCSAMRALRRRGQFDAVNGNNGSFQHGITPCKVRLTQWRRGYHGVMCTVTLFCVGMQNVCVVGREALSAPPPLGRTRHFFPVPQQGTIYAHDGHLVSFGCLHTSGMFARLLRLYTAFYLSGGGLDPDRGRGIKGLPMTKAKAKSGDRRGHIPQAE